MKKLFPHLCSLLFFFLATVYLTYPLIFHMTSMATGLSDELLISWIQNWVIHALVTNPLRLFQADIYYPFTNSLAYSDIFLPTSIFAAPFLWIWKEPIITYNITQFFSFFLLGFCAYIFYWYLTRNFWVSLLCGTMILFSPVTLDKHVHLQILGIGGVFLAILFFIQFLQSARTRFLILSLLCFIVQSYNSFLPGYFIVFGYVIFAGFYVASHKEKLVQLLQVKNLLLFVVAFALLIPIAIPYFQVSKEFHYTRDIRDAIHFALQPEDLVNAGSFSRLQPLLMKIPVTQVSQYGEIKQGFLGGILTLLSIAVCIYAYKLRKKIKEHWVFFASFLTASVGLILSFGPALHINRVTIHHPFPIFLPYTVFYYILPGFQGFRNSARWEMLFLLFIVVCIAIMLHALTKKFSIRVKLLIFIPLIAITLLEYNFPMQLYSVPQTKDFPKEYQWLTTVSQNSKIVEMPIYNWSMLPYSYQEQLRGYYNITYFLSTMSGFSGFSPPPWQTLVTNLLATFPSDGSLEELKTLHINYILVHKDEYDMLSAKHFVVNKTRIPNGSDIITALDQNKKVHLVKIFKNTYIYHIL